MNKLSTFSLSCVLVATSLGLFSCEDSENTPATQEDGRPSALNDGVQAYYFTYEDQRLSSIQERDGASQTFKYVNNELTTLETLPPKGVADGSGFTLFKKKDEHLIRVESCGEPSLDMQYVEEISLDENGLPLKITDAGIFRHTGEGSTLLEKGRSYSTFTIDPSTKNLLKLETYSLEDSTLIESYAYTYDSQSGITSQVDCPAWFPYYWSYRHSYSYDSSNILFLNHINNVIEITHENPQEPKTVTVTYAYTYNSNQFPIKIKENSNGKNTDITY